MSLQMGFTKKLEIYTEKVKAVDMHPSEPWVASALYNGTLSIHNYNTQALVKKLEVSDAPLRCCKFVPRKQWIVAAGDKMCIAVYNYNSLEKVAVIDAHKDFVRYLDLHATLPYVISCSDDMTVVLWDIDKNWEKVAVFEGHSHYVMMAKWSPKDHNIFATCALDKTISFWRVALESDKPQPATKPFFTLTGHERGVTCIDFCTNLSCPYIISGSDDCSIRVWDYQTKLCLQVLKKHFKSVTCVLYHPRLPIILSAGEDGDFNVWNANLYKIKRSLNYGTGRLWHVASNKTHTALASDSGTSVLELLGGKPLAAMHANKLLMVKSSDIMTCNLTAVAETAGLDPSQPLTLPFRSIGSSEFFPQYVSYHPNGRFICLCGDSEYIIYTSQVGRAHAQGMKSKTYGKAAQLVWSFEGDYATFDGLEVSVFSEFTLKEKLEAQQVTRLHGGRLLGLSTNSGLYLYTWAPCQLVKHFPLDVEDVYWDPFSNKLALASQVMAFVLSFNADEQASSRSNARGAFGAAAEDEHANDELFKLEMELVERVTSAVWVRDTLVFVTAGSHLNLFVAGQVETLAYLDKPLHLVGYLPETQLLYLCDEAVYAHQLPLSYVEFHSRLHAYSQAAALGDRNQDFEDAELVRARDGLRASLGALDARMRERASKLLQQCGECELALLATENPDLKFELHMRLGNVAECRRLLEKETLDGCARLVSDDPAEAGRDVALVLGLDDMLRRKWKRLGDFCLKATDLAVAKLAFKYANDLSNLLVVHTLTGDAAGVRYVAQAAQAAKMSNVAFTAFYMLNEVEQCIQVPSSNAQILHAAGRHAEATFMARTYRPSLLKASFARWNDKLRNKLMAPLFDDTEHADPEPLRNGFPDAAQYLKHKNAFFSEFAKAAAETPARASSDQLDL